jgi:hypothetical protein
VGHNNNKNTVRASEWCPSGRLAPPPPLSFPCKRDLSTPSFCPTPPATSDHTQKWDGCPIHFLNTNESTSSWDSTPHGAIKNHHFWSRSMQDKHVIDLTACELETSTYLDHLSTVNETSTLCIQKCWDATTLDNMMLSVTLLFGFLHGAISSYHWCDFFFQVKVVSVS